MSQTLELVVQFNEKELKIDPTLADTTIQETLSRYKDFVQAQDLCYWESPTIYHLFMRKPENA